MKIANPLYDHAFKYLMSNDKLARKVLSVILEKEVPKGFEDIAEYLQRPLQEEDIRAKLRAEEEVEAMFAQQEAENAYYKRTAEEERRQKEEAKAREEEERRQKEEERRQKEEALEQAREARIKLARLLLRSGMSVKDAALETGLSEDELSELDQ